MKRSSSSVWVEVDRQYFNISDSIFCEPRLTPEKHLPTRRQFSQRDKAFTGRTLPNFYGMSLGSENEKENGKWYWTFFKIKLSMWKHITGKKLIIEIELNASASLFLQPHYPAAWCH